MRHILKRFVLPLLGILLSFVITPSAYSQTLGTYTEQNGAVKNQVGVAITGGGTAATVTAGPSDAFANAFNALRVQNFGTVFNGTTWDRQKGDLNGTVVIPALTNTWWRYVPPTNGLTNSTVGITIKAAAGAGVSNYIMGGECTSDAIAVATELELRDGAGGAAMWRIKVPTAGWTQGFDIVFSPPLRGTANTLVEYAAVTANGTGSIYCNWRGATGF